MSQHIVFLNVRTQQVERAVPIVAAHNLGLEVVVVSDRPPEDTLDVDHSIVMNTFDEHAVIKAVSEFASEHEVKGVVTWSDKDVEVTAKIAHLLGVPGIPIEKVSRVRNKGMLRECLNKVPGASPAFFRVSTFNEFTNAVRDIAGHCIFKPAGASGSTAILHVTPDDDLSALFMKMQSLTEPSPTNVFSYYPGQYIVEAYLDGPEICIDGLVYENKAYVIGVTDKDVTSDYSIEYTAFHPSTLEKATIVAALNRAAEVVDAIGLNNSAFHLECRVVDGIVKVLEIAGRPAGGFIASHLMRLSRGYDYCSDVIRVSIGQRPLIADREFNVIRFAGAKKLLPAHQGVLRSLSGLENAMEVNGVEHVIPSAHVGQKLSPPPERFADKVATIIATGATKEDMHNSLARAEAAIRFEIA